MFKDVFVLKKNSYHAKMMKWIWNLNYYDFSHMCPYWWLSVFNHIIFIPYAVVRLSGRYIWRFFNSTGDLFSDSLTVIADWIEEKERRHYQRMAEFYKNNPDNLINLTGKKLTKFFDKIDQADYFLLNSQYNTVRDLQAEEERKQKRIKELDEYNKRQAELKKKFVSEYRGDNVDLMLETGDYVNWFEEKKRNEKEKLKNWQERQAELEAQRRRAAKDRINKIVKVIKPVITILAYTAGVVIGLYLCYQIFRFLHWVWEGIASIHHSTWLKAKEVSITGAEYIFGICLFVVIVVGLIVLLRKVDFSFDFKVPKYITKPFTYIPKPFIWVYKKIIRPTCKWIHSAFWFLIQMVKQNCPAISWED